MKQYGPGILVLLFVDYVKAALGNKQGQIIMSAVVLLMIWGTHGKLELLGAILPQWQGPGSNVYGREQILAGIPWDHELISFWSGAFLLLIIPILIIKLCFKDNLADYGLGLPPKNHRVIGIWGFIVLTVLSLPAFILGADDASVNSTYPFFREFDNLTQFMVYELTYLPFFIAIEFIFRGYLLFGLAPTTASTRAFNPKSLKADFKQYNYVLIIQMLSYTAWHLGKPLAEVWGTLFWGLAAATVAYTSKSIWPVVFSHWILNVVLDALVVMRHIGT